MKKITDGMIEQFNDELNCLWDAKHNLDRGWFTNTNLRIRKGRILSKLNKETIEIYIEDDGICNNGLIPINETFYDFIKRYFEEEWDIILHSNNNHTIYWAGDD